jgi:ribosomal protein S1
VKEWNESGALLQINNEVVGLLPHGHLSDVDDKTQVSKLKNLVCIDDSFKFQEDRIPLFTMKPSLLSSIKQNNFPSNFAQLNSLVESNQSKQNDTFVFGFISNIKSYGVFIRFANRFTAFAPMSNLVDGFISDPHDVFKVNQTVLCKVMQLKVEQSQVIVSLKP